MKQVKHWQDPVNALLGAWLILSPWLLGFSGVTVAVASTLGLGILLVACNVGAMSASQAWEEWLDATFGVLLMLAPWLLGFDGQPAATQNALFTGLVVTVLALWVLGTDDSFGGWWHKLVG